MAEAMWVANFLLNGQCKIFKRKMEMVTFELMMFDKLK